MKLGDNVKKLMTLAFQYKLFPISMGIVSFLLALTVVIQNIGIATFLDTILFKKNDSLFLLLVIVLVILLIRATLNMLNQLLGDTLASKVKYKLRIQVIQHSSNRNIGKQINIITETIDGITSFFNSYLPQVFKSTFIPLVIMITMCFIHLNTALIMLVTAPFIPLFYIIFGLKTRDEAKDQMTYLNQFSQRFLNTAKGLVTLKLFNKSESAEKKLYDESTHFRDLTMTILKSAFLSGLMLEFISMLGIGLVALEATLSLVVFETIDFKTAAIAIILAPEFYNSIKDLGQAFHTGKQSEGSSDVIFEFLEENQQTTIHQTRVHDSYMSQIKLSNVSFKYNDSNTCALQNVSFSINEGEKIALVGDSGAGKTTLARLISQSLIPTEGYISYDKDDFNVGFLSQNPYIFSDTIRNNITMYKKIAENEINQVLIAVGLKEKVDSLAQGLETQIGEGGEMLSGGQMRRLELCRVLLMNPDLVIFDEPSTGLDLKTEQTIHNAINEHFNSTSTIIISHSETTLSLAERKISLENGQIIKDTRVDAREKVQGGRLK